MSNTVHATADLITLRVSLARIAQAMFSGETSNSTPFDGLPDVLGKGAAELYVLARNEDRGWNSLAMLIIHEIQHSQLMHEREIKEKDALIAELRDELASTERSYERLRNVNVALGSANTSASNEIERLRARMLEARRVLDI